VVEELAEKCFTLLHSTTLQREEQIKQKYEKDVLEIGNEAVSQMDLTQDRFHLRAFVMMVKNFLDP
jgi:hypothetical protein